LRRTVLTHRRHRYFERFTASSFAKGDIFEGDITTGTGGGNLFSASNDIRSDDVSEALYKAARDKAVKAIVFRVSSPGGGNSTATLRRASIENAQEPVASAGMALANV